MTSDPDLRQLRAFAAVHDTGSVSGAARKLHLTQPALSRRMASSNPRWESGSSTAPAVACA